MSSVIVPKSDQINADDLIAGPRTVTIASVSIKPGTEQPVSISLEGDRKVFRPCKSMARVLVSNWGADASQYVGRSMTLYRDKDVLWGGMAVGGIRISHMSHIPQDAVMPLTEKKGSRKLFTVKVLQVAKEEPAVAPAANKPVPFMDRVGTMLTACKTLAEVDEAEAKPAIQNALSMAPQETVHRLNGMFSARRKELEPAETVDLETGEISNDEWASLNTNEMPS